MTHGHSFPSLACGVEADAPAGQKLVRLLLPRWRAAAYKAFAVLSALPTPHRVLSLPATALLNDATGLHVAVVDARSRIHNVHVVVERDTGPTVEVASGLSAGDRVVKLPTAQLTEGREVEVVR